MNDTAAARTIAHDVLNQHLVLLSEITLCTQAYANEVSLAAPAPSYLEAWASRLLRRAAELYALTHPNSPRLAPLEDSGERDPRTQAIVELWDGRKD